MTTRFKFLIAACLLTTVSCSIREEQYIEKERHGERLVFEAVYAEQPDTKTEVQSDGKSVWWSPQEDINIFYGASASSKFTSTNTSPVAKAQFSGELTAFTGETETGQSEYYWAVYPYNEANICDGSSITAVLPKNQTAKAESFADSQWMTIARSQGLALSFYAVCAGFRFSITKEGVTSVTFRGNGNEVLAGKARIGMDSNGHPTVLENITEEREITLNAPLGQSFAVGTLYYITFFPVTFENGFTITFYTETEKAIRVYEESIAFNRTDVHRGRDWDDSLTYQKMYHHPEAVDLGLSVKWAPYNLGATAPEEYGNYYAWGEVTSKNSYSYSNYVWGTGLYSLNKYNNNTLYGIVDNKTVLTAEDDAACAQWGGNWRMPTIDEFNELLNKCSWEWTSNYKGTSVSGFIGTSTLEDYTSESIFLPAGGSMFNEQRSGIGEHGLYWLSQNSSEYATEGWGFIVEEGKPTINYWDRISGHMIRPVFGKRIAVEDISLDKTSVELGYGQQLQLNVTFSPSNAPEKGVIWTSSDVSVASVSQSGLITAMARGDCIITATSTDSPQANTCCRVVVGEPKPLDMGLSVKWGCLNVGATSVEESGEFFSWGDIQQHSNTEYRTYLWASNGKLTKYCMRPGSGLDGYVDNKTKLDPLDDIVHWRFGGKWRMPSTEEFNELLDETKCSWEWTKVYEKTGYLITSLTTGASIFLPRTGYYYRMSSLYSTGNGYYWSSSLRVDSSWYAYSMEFSKSSYKSDYHDRGDELAIRPVYDESIIPITGLVLDKETVTLKIGESTSIYATVIPGNATYKDALIWSSSDESVVSITGDGLVSAHKVGTATITADMGGGIYALCSVIVNYACPEVVDLGLSKLWATFNLGAKSPEEMGYLYAWGEVVPKDRYDSQNYKWSNGGTFEGSYTKYCPYATYGVNGFVDNLNELLPEDDAAFASLGNGWSIPTYKDFRELLEKCDKEWVEVNGIFPL